MSEFGPVGIDALVDAAWRWLRWAWVILPAMTLAIVTFVLRYRVARQAMQRLDAQGAGPWFDGRTCVRGTLELRGAVDEQGLIEFATLTKRTKAAMPEKLTTNTELRVVLADGRALRVPASTAMRYELGSKPERAVYKVVSREESGRNELQHGSIRAAPGAPVWLVGFFNVPPGDAAWRSASQIELARLDEVELHFEMPRPPETRIGMDYAVVCTTTLLGVMIAFAEWWQIPLALIQGLFMLASA